MRGIDEPEPRREAHGTIIELVTSTGVSRGTSLPSH
jgi:hypothetical protein